MNKFIVAKTLGRGRGYFRVVLEVLRHSICDDTLNGRSSSSFLLEYRPLNGRQPKTVESLVRVLPPLNLWDMGSYKSPLSRLSERGLDSMTDSEQEKYQTRRSGTHSTLCVPPPTFLPTRPEVHTPTPYLGVPETPRRSLTSPCRVEVRVLGTGRFIWGHGWGKSGV